MNNDFISLDRNDSFTYLRGIELQDLIVTIENYFLEYRDKLNLPNDVTIGVEIEYERLRKKIIDKFIEKKLLSKWTSKTDVSLFLGGEITSPIMTDSPECWKELKIVCDYLKKRRVDTLHNAGGHIHIGAHILGEDIEAWKNFLKLYTIYENILLRFFYGDKISGRKKMTKYAQPIADKLYQRLDKINETQALEDIKKITALSKFWALNFNNTEFYNINNNVNMNTIEFRSPNATTNAIIWQNNINTVSKMLISSRNKVIDEEFLDYKLKHEFHSYAENSYLYNDINLKNVLEFVDLIFVNNLDKAYFLRQYLKDFQENYDFKKAVKAKRFTMN